MIIDFWLKWPLRFSARLLNFRFVHLNKRKTEKHKMNSSLGIEKKNRAFSSHDSGIRHEETLVYIWREKIKI